jgi:HAMP domain-containing protein
MVHDECVSGSPAEYSVSSFLQPLQAMSTPPPPSSPPADPDATQIISLSAAGLPGAAPTGTPSGPAGAKPGDDATLLFAPVPSRPATLHPGAAAAPAEGDDRTIIAPMSDSRFGALTSTGTATSRPPADEAPISRYPESAGRDSMLPGETLHGASSSAAAHSGLGLTAIGGGEGGEAAGAVGLGAGQVRQVGRYLVKARLGRGGMATVYRASDPQIGRDVAIKFLHASLSEDDECRMRFLREARAAGGLSHPNIVVVHDVGEIEGRPYMAMELIDGLPLSETLERSRTLPIRDVVIIGLQLARALEYAHARGIVHRDIKPGNIMLLGDGQTIKVADFGIAHMDDGQVEQRTVVGAVMGTPQYMSPEQTRGDKVDGRSDLFSAGIVLYQMLAGERPFRGDSLVAVATRIANEEPPPLNQKRPEVPPSLRRVVDRCLAKQPAQRYQTGKELSEALLKVLGELDEAARERDKPRIVPLRVKWALMMGLIVAVVMGISAAVITQRQYAAMMGQASDYGASLARFIAAQNAAHALGEDWDSVEVAVQEIMKTGSFERIVVMDMAGVVKVSSATALTGKPYVAPGGGGGAAGQPQRFVSNGQDVLGFEAPVLFQGKQVGRVALGIPEAPLTAVARLSISLMVALAVVTVLAVAIAMYFVANWFAKPIRLVGESMAEIGKGRFDHRINEQRNDEFGQLFQQFDAMAQSLQQRLQEEAPPPAPGGDTGSGAAR